MVIPLQVFTNIKGEFHRLFRLGVLIFDQNGGVTDAVDHPGVMLRQSRLEFREIGRRNGFALEMKDKRTMQQNGKQIRLFHAMGQGIFLSNDFVLGVKQMNVRFKGCGGDLLQIHREAKAVEFGLVLLVDGLLCRTVRDAA